tara:strand:- start:381 stop:983 length:603 start_codon:yes stop_codon:yes gene_type:complete
MSSVYKKLAKARVTLQGVDLKKSGHNKFANYYYFELGDFLPTVNKIFDELGLCDVIKFGQEMAVLDIFDTESGEVATFTSPMASASLKGCHDIQNLGATQTYLRRYLWVTAMGIVEHDALDGSKPIDVAEICKQAVDRNKKSVDAVKDYLADPTDANIQLAKEAFAEIKEEDQMAMWKAPTKVSTAPFSTEERKLLKGII